MTTTTNSNATPDTSTTAAADVAFNQKCEELGRLLRGADCSDLRARYAVAQAVKSIKDEKQFGKQAVKRMAEKLGYGAENVYAHGSVADAWSEAEFKALAERCKDAPARMSFSHFIELAPLKKEAREQLLERCFTHKLSVRDVKGMKAEMSPRKDKSKVAPPKEVAPDAPSGSEDVSRRAFAELAQYAKTELEHLGADTAPDEIERLRAECEELKALVSQLEDGFAKIALAATKANAA